MAMFVFLSVFFWTPYVHTYITSHLVTLFMDSLTFSDSNEVV